MADQTEPRWTVLGIATILLLLVTVLLVAGKFTWNANHVAEKKPRTRVVRLARPIPAFSRIGAGDVRMDTATVAVPGGVATDSAKVVGRVVTLPLDSGALVPSRRLVDLDGEWVVLSVGTDSVLAGRVGDTISLLAGMSPDTAKELVNATAISLGTRGAKSYLAVHPEDLQRFAAYYQKDVRFLAVRRIPPLPGTGAATQPNPATTPPAPDTSRRAAPRPPQRRTRRQ
jgi:hypothetical protein